jgi:hypothetical protein
MPVADRSDAAQGIDGIPGRGTLTFTLNGALQTLRIPGVGERGQSSRRGDQLLGASTALGR